jgi:hypothetical protein
MVYFKSSLLALLALRIVGALAQGDVPVSSPTNAYPLQHAPSYLLLTACGLKIANQFSIEPL